MRVEFNGANLGICWIITSGDLTVVCSGLVPSACDVWIGKHWESYCVCACTMPSPRRQFEMKCVVKMATSGGYAITITQLVATPRGAVLLEVAVNQLLFIAVSLQSEEDIVFGVS